MLTRKRGGGDAKKAISKPRKKLSMRRNRTEPHKDDQLALAAIVDCARDALWSWTPDGTIARWNAEASRLFGYSAKEMVGRSLLLLVPAERHERAREVIKNVAQGQWYGQCETVRVRKDGSKVDVELTVSPIVDGRGQVVECLTSCRDIGDRKQIQSVLAGRVNELTTLIRFTENLQAADTFQDIYTAAFAAIHDALGCERASVRLFDSAKVMRFVAWRGLSDEYRRAVDSHSPLISDTPTPEPICINDIDLANAPDTLKAVIKAEGIRSLAFIPLLAKGRLIGKFVTYYREPHVFSAEETRLANTIAQQLAIAIDRQVVQEEREEVRRRVAADLSAMTRLLELGSLCAREGHDESKCLSAVVDTAIAITGAPRGSLQLVDARSGALTIAAQHGFSASFLSYFACVPQNAPVTAAAAMRAKQRIIVEDVTKSGIFYDPARVKVLLEAGVWAVQSTPLIDADGKVFGVISTHFAETHRPQDRELRFIDLLARQTADYLSRIHAEGALRSLQSSLEAEVKSRTRERDRIWNVSEDLLGVSNFEGYFLSINPAWQKTLGWSEDEIKAVHVNDLGHPDDTAHSWSGREQLARGVPTVRMENRFRHKDGSWRWIAWTMTADQGLIYVAGRHVTAEKEAADVLQRAQEQLANAQKMEALGQLTGGVAHDFNNIMMIVSGYAQTLKGRLNEPKHVRALQAIEAAVSRAESLTRQLLSFSRHQPLNPTVLHPADAVGAIQDVLSGSATGKIELSVDIPNDCWPICVDKSEFALALVNIALNARDAMPSGGWLSIKCENMSFDASNSPDGLSGDFVAFRISDTGCGIAANVLPKVFDPFFTTKEVEKGTGLGLSQVYGFARRSGGSVVIQSEMQRGATVTLCLPRSQQLISAERNQDGARPKGSRKETILVVEDNADVRSVAIALLNELGYRTLEANSATSALSALDCGTHIDLVFSDIVLPGSIDGVSLAQEVAVRHPRISILLTTGYARRVDAELKHPVLRKPYDIIALDGALREAIQTHKLMIEEGRVLRTQMTAMPGGEARIRR